MERLQAFFLPPLEKVDSNKAFYWLLNVHNFGSTFSQKVDPNKAFYWLLNVHNFGSTFSQKVDPLYKDNKQPQLSNNPRTKHRVIYRNSFFQ